MPKPDVKTDPGSAGGPCEIARGGSAAPRSTARAMRGREDRPLASCLVV